MRRSDARLLLLAARDWHARGWLSAEGLAHIERQQAAQPVEEDGASVAQTVLYGLGGALLGAAAIALVLLLDMPSEAGTFLLTGLALLLLGGGVTLGLTLRRGELGDALLVGGLVALAVAGFMSVDTEYALNVVPWLAPAACLALVWTRGDRAMVPLLATAGLFLLSILPLQMHVEQEKVAISVWCALGIAFTGAVWATDALRPRSWTGAALGTCALGLAGATIAFTFGVLEIDQAGVPEALLAVVEGALLAAGLALRHRPLIVVPGLVIAIDAVVFAFDVGGLVVGVVSLLAVAGALLGLATYLRRRLQV